ncbi:MAG: response regulator, partial [Tidjanibacter sp.]|nr:response regulator [Tidjanibacter sp.]
LRMAKLRTEARIEQDTAEMKLKFFTNISHELRTPLTLIMGGIEEVQKHENLSPRAENSLTLSYKNSKRMLSLINQILDFRKVVKNKMELRVERLDIVELAKGVVDDFRDLADERKISLMFSFSRENITLWGDRQRLESLLYNLLSNSMKFTHNKGTIALEVISNEEQGLVTIRVQDNGIGIPKERLGSVFDRFAQYASAVRGDTGGSGIGLSLCKEIVELHKGTIDVESKVGSGTTFTIGLPLGNAHFEMNQIDFGGDSTQEESTPSGPRRKGVTAPEGAQKILLVEDNSEVRAFIYNNLIDTYRVVEAADGQEALEKIASEQPDIVITDLMMPKMDGIELVNHIRKDFETSHIPVVMLTAKQTPEERIRAMKYGADGYITKPFSMELLLAKIDNLLSQRRILFEKMSKGSARNRIVEAIPKSDVVVTNKDERFLQQIMAWIEENIENSELTIDDMASHMLIGRTTLYNKIKSLTGKSPVELIKEYRITKSEMLLRTGQFAVSEVAYKVGFSDPGYFSRCFKEQYKSSPVEYLKKHKVRVES